MPSKLEAAQHLMAAQTSSTLLDSEIWMLTMISGSPNGSYASGSLSKCSSCLILSDSQLEDKLQPKGDRMNCLTHPVMWDLDCSRRFRTFWYLPDGLS